MNRDDLLRYFRDTASEITERDLSDVTPSTCILDLGMDSLGTLELVGAFERKFSVYIPSEELGDVKTVADLIGVVEAKWQSRPQTN